MCPTRHNTNKTLHWTQNCHVGRKHGQMCLLVQFYTNLFIYLYTHKVEDIDINRDQVKTCLHIMPIIYLSQTFALMHIKFTYYNKSHEFQLQTTIASTGYFVTLSTE